MVFIFAGTSSPANPLGINGFHAYNPPDFRDNPESVSSYMSWEAECMAEAGLGWNRTLSPSGGQFIWGEIQFNKDGPYNWDLPDLLVSKCQENNIQLLAEIHPFAMWDQPSEFPPKYCIPNDTTAWNKFLTALVERYDGDGVNDMPGLVAPIKYWEISNEVEGNFCDGDYSKYATFLSQTYATIKAADPTAKVLNGSTVPIYDVLNPTETFDVSINYWQGFFSSGGGNYFDMFGVHYTCPEPALPLKAFLDQYQNLLDTYGIDKPMWLTETCTYSGSIAKSNVEYSPQSTTYQAAWWIKHISYALAHNVGKIFWTIFYNYEEIPPPSGDDWFNGVSMIDSDVPYDQGPDKKPVSYTTSKFTELTSGYTSVTELDYSNTCGTHTAEAECTSQGKYKYMLGLEYLWILWNNEGENYSLDVSGIDSEKVIVMSSVPKLDGDGYPLLDEQGNAIFDSLEVNVSDDTATVALSNIPVFVYAGETSYPGLSVSPTSLDFGEVEIGSTKDLTLTVQNTRGGTLTGSATTSSPFSIVSGGSFSLGAGESQTVTIRFSPTTTGIFTGQVSISSNGGDATVAVTGTGVTTTPCPVATALEEDPNKKTKLELLRQFRDEVLGGSPEGEHYVELFYAHAVEVSWLLLSYPELRSRSWVLIDRFLPVVQALLAGEQAVVRQADLREVGALLGAFAAYGSAELQADIQAVQTELRQGDVLEQFGIVVE